MDNKTRAERFTLARIGLNQHGEETKTKVYEETGVPASALVAYENPESNRTVNTDYVLRLADHYGVNAAWLLGQTESWSNRVDVQQIGEMTGLNPEAVMALQELMKDNERKDFINKLIASEEFARIVYTLQGLKHLKTSDDSSSAVDYAEAFNRNSDGELELTLCESDYTDLKLWKAEKEITRLMERLAKE